MIGNPSTTAGAPQDPRPRRGGRRPSPSLLLMGLEQIRKAVRERLDQIEALALKPQAAPPPVETSDRERALQLRIAELEQAQDRLLVEEKRREQQWQAALEQLESDRQLLAEAWQRLEREQVDAVEVRSRHARSEPARDLARAAVPGPRDPVAADPNDSITRAILKQFQSLRSDVRGASLGRHTRR